MSEAGSNGAIGARTWASASYIAAAVETTVYLADREPGSLYRLTVPARRTLCARFNDLAHPA